MASFIPKDVILVVSGGTIGGLAVIHGWDTVTAFGSVNFPMLRELVFEPTILGSIAALLGVFLFTAAAPESRTKMFVFSIACGLAFPTWLQNAGSLSDDARNRIVQESLPSIVNNIASTASEQRTDPASVSLVNAEILRLNKLQSIATGNARNDVAVAKSNARASLEVSALKNNPEVIHALQ